MSIRLMEITTTIACHNLCSYCPQELFIERYGNEGGRTAKFMSLQTYQECISKLPIDYQISFSGFTEPFQNPNCIDMIEWTAHESREMYLFTTLRYVTLGILERLKSVEFMLIRIHVPDQTMHFTPNGEYYSVLNEVVSGALKTKILDYVAPYKSVDPEALKIITTDKIDFTNRISRAGNIGDWVAHNAKVECSRSPDLSQNVLLPDGRVQVCCCDYGLSFTKGNLKSGSFVDLKEVDPTPLCIKCEHARPIKRV